GVAYALASRASLWLHVVNLCLVANWFGDSLDGTLARYRQRLRPRYGFYVDHMVDAFGALFLLGGLALSGLMSPILALGLLVAYLLLWVEIALSTHTLGTFRMSFGLFGGTELRILLALANVAVATWPQVHGPWGTWRVFDLIGAVGIAGIAVTLT